MASKRKILIVDDSASIRAYFAQVLGGLYEIELAVNGVEGIEKLLQHRFDVILVDVNMPLMDGYEFVRRLRTSAELWAATPIVMITSEQEEKDCRAAFAVGANLFLTKPVKSQELLDIAELLLAEGGW